MERSVLVTGGTVRLGRAIADELARRGWRVLRSSHRADAGADLVADLAAPDGADALFAAACERLGGAAPRALVNNAALYGRADPSALRQVNFASPRRLVERLAAAWADAASCGATPCAVNILDGCLRREYADYCAAKEALAAYTREAAERLAPVLRVRGVAPREVLGLAPTGVRERARTAMPDRPTPQQVARAVADLVEGAAATGVIQRL